MGLKVYNSLGQKKEDFVTVNEGEVNMYVCGPTVYDFLHVGNFRGPVFYNFMRNWLEHLGYKVSYAYNFTDVDDKIIQRARDEGVTAPEIAERFIDEFWKDFLALDLRRHDHNPKVTECIPEIVDYIGQLIEAGKAYEVDGEVLYSVRSFEGYGKLSGRNPDDMISGSRIEVDQKKRDPLDFALWKPRKEGEQGWESPWGPGRPGWHIECTVMIKKIFGQKIDIHGGGIDLLFPHHENEIAQGEGCGDEYVSYWMHNNFLNFDGQKMSKSLGNIRTMRSFLEEYNAEIFKFMILSVHYRSLNDFSDQAINNAVSGLSRIYSALSMATDYIQDADGVGDAHPDFVQKIVETEKMIEETVNDDFGTPKMFAGIFEVVRQFNGLVKRGVKAKPQLLGNCRVLLDFIGKYGELLALFRKEPAEFLVTLDDMLLRQKGIQRSDVDALIEERKEARANKDWAKSDEVRDQLVEMGIAVQDLPSGTYWEVAK